MSNSSHPNFLRSGWGTVLVSRVTVPTDPADWRDYEPDRASTEAASRALLSASGDPAVALGALLGACLAERVGKNSWRGDEFLDVAAALIKYGVDLLDSADDE